MEKSRMNLELSFENADGYLLVQVKGEWIENSVGHAIEDIAKVAQERGSRYILLDIRDLSAPKNYLQRFLAGKKVAEVSRGRFKIAAVYHEELIDKSAEISAVNRGAEMVVLSDFDEAVQWLKKDMPSDPHD